jgi:putative transposase
MPPQVKLSLFVNKYKSVTSQLLRKKYKQELAPYYWKPLFWSDSYFISTVSEKSREDVHQYILAQRTKK